MDTPTPEPTLRPDLSDDDEPLTVPAEFEVAGAGEPRVELESERFDAQILAALVAP